jgi:signal transduction histidine kinase
MGPEVPGRAVGDGFRLEQVLASLVENAVKFTDRGEVEVRVAATQRQGEVVRVRFEVKDTGIGIPAEHVGTVFKGFVQADASSTRRHEGVGLGLATAHRLVGRMGGRLEVQSEPGRGSVFWFEIPLRSLATGRAEA